MSTTFMNTNTMEAQQRAEWRTTWHNSRGMRYQRSYKEGGWRDQRDREYCREQVRIVNERNEAMFARIAAKYDGYWQTNADGSQTLIIPTK